jgi:1-phosphatidylinositol phosphodiesterase
MRGKIVILQDFARWQCDSPSSKAEFGLCYNSFDIQDEFQVPGNAFLYNKWEKVKKHLGAANDLETSPGNKDVKYMNYLSGVGTAGSLGVPNPYFVVSGHIDPATGSPRLWTGDRVAGNGNLFPNFPRETCPHLLGRCIFYEGTNTLVYGAIRTGYYTKRVGIIMTDFPGGGLIERIICINYPKTDPLCKRLPPCTGPMCAKPKR